MCIKGDEKMLLKDEQYIIKWLSQYGPLYKQQVIRLLPDKPAKTVEKIIRGLKQQMRIMDVNQDYLGLDNMCEPSSKTVIAVWVLLKFIDHVEPLAHYPATYPAQLFFLKDNTGYEIIVLYENEECLLRLLQTQKDTKYIIVVPNVSMISKLILPKNICCLFAVVDSSNQVDPKIDFYTKELKNNDTV